MFWILMTTIRRYFHKVTFMLQNNKLTILLEDCWFSAQNYDFRSWPGVAVICLKHLCLPCV